MANANTTAPWNAILLCADFCTYHTLGNLIVRHLGAPLQDEIFPFCQQLWNWAALTWVLRNYFLYLPESKLLRNSWKTRISATFFLCLLPFIFLTQLGLVNVEEKRQTRKDLEEPKGALMRELLWEKKNIKTKPRTSHIPTYGLLKRWNERGWELEQKGGRLQMDETTLSKEGEWRAIKARKTTR